jgi:pilus assembly protein CpaF
VKTEEGIQQLLKILRERLTQDRFEDKEEEEIREIAWRYLEEEAEGNFSWLMLGSFDKEDVLDRLLRNIFGFGILDPFLKMPEVTEIMINGPKTIFIENQGKLIRAVDGKNNPICFSDENELMHIIEKIVSKVNRKVDEGDPIVDARLPDGSRVNAVIRPISLDGPVVTIRKFPETPFAMEHLINFGAITREVADLLQGLVQARYNIIVSGGTGSGKTTFLNALSMNINENERIITIEDAAELKLSKAKNLVRLETRPANVEGKGSIPMRSLIKSALRMRPDRIIVGEVRGGEALDMLQAMNTGHDGSLTTAHSNSALDLISRLETMVLMAGMELPIPAIRSQIASAIDFIVHLSKFRDGKRRVTQITEILGMKDGQIITRDLFKLQITGVGEDGKLLGQLVHTGHFIQSLGKLITSGVVIHDYLINKEQWDNYAEQV